MRNLLCLVGATLAAALMLPVSSALAAEDGSSGSANYVCSLTAGGSTDVSVTMSLDNAPTSVTPGQTLRLAGTLTFGFTAQTALGTQLLLASKVGVSSAAFALDAASAHQTDAIEAMAVQGKQTAIGKPFALSAKVMLPDYTVPSNAGGDVVFSLPSAARLPNSVAKSPANVAFTAVLNENGLVSQRGMACALSGTTTPLIARIPVVVPAGASGAKLPTGLSPGSGLPALSVPASTAGLGAPAASAQASPTEAKTRPVFEAIPPSTRHDGVFIPAWSIVLLAVMFPLGAITYALSLQHRLRMMQLAADPNRLRSRS